MTELLVGAQNVVSSPNSQKPSGTPPFFIVGCGRSGTTLVKSILTAHPDLYVMPETFFFQSILPRIAHCENAPWSAADSWWLAESGVTPKSIKPFVKKLLKKGYSPKCSLLIGIFDFHQSRNASKSIGEKTPDHIQHLEAIRFCFPDARIIQVVRDPRAVLASFRKVKVGSNAVFEVVKEWSQAIVVLEKWQGTEGFLKISYEDLVEKPEVTLKSICETLGVPWSRQLLEYHRRSDKGYALEQTHHANTLRPLFADSLDSWHNELSDIDVALVEWALSEKMLRQGYMLEGKMAHCPRLRMMMSLVKDKIHRYFVRVPRQRLKAIRARRRQARENAGL